MYFRISDGDAAASHVTVILSSPPTACTFVGAFGTADCPASVIVQVLGAPVRVACAFAGVPAEYCEGPAKNGTFGWTVCPAQPVSSAL